MTKISVLLPIRNEGNHISLCLEQIINQKNMNENVEIIVSDGMSNDRSREIVEYFQKDHSNIRIIDNPGKIVSTGINAAIQIAKGEILIRVDGHTSIAPDYVSQCVNALQRTGADNVGGRMDAIGNTPFGKAVAIATSTPFGVGGSRFHYSEKEELVDSVYMGAWRREVFEKIGLFDEELVRDQDDEFNYRLRAHGGKIFLCPKIQSVYTVRSNPQSLWKQYFQYGYWKVRVLQKHPRQMNLRHFIPPLFVGTLAFLIILSLFTDWGRWMLALVGGAYLIANLIFSLLTAARRGWQHLPLLPITFATLHLSYGSGFLSGLIHFWNRWGDKQGKVPKLHENNA